MFTDNTITEDNLIYTTDLLNSRLWRVRWWCLIFYSPIQTGVNLHGVNSYFTGTLWLVHYQDRPCQRFSYPPLRKLQTELPSVFHQAQQSSHNFSLIQITTTVFLCSCHQVGRKKGHVWLLLLAIFIQSHSTCITDPPPDIKHSLRGEMKKTDASRILCDRFIVFSNSCWNTGSPQTERASVSSLLQHLFNCLDAMLWMKCDHMFTWHKHMGALRTQPTRNLLLLW